MEYPLSNSGRYYSLLDYETKGASWDGFSESASCFGIWLWSSEPFHLKGKLLVPMAGT
jgi:hypothetical protein